MSGDLLSLEEKRAELEKKKGNLANKKVECDGARETLDTIEREITRQHNVVNKLFTSLGMEPILTK